MNLFAYDTVTEYMATPDKYLNLKQAQLKKLEMITIVDMASKSALLSYDEISRKLGIEDTRQVEEKIIECIYSNLLKGKLNQKKQ